MLTTTDISGLGLLWTEPIAEIDGCFLATRKESVTSFQMVLPYGFLP